MALVKCKECGKEVSSAATACPHCGAPTAQPSAVAAARSRLWLGVKLFVGFIFLIFVYQCTQSMSRIQEPGVATKAAAVATPAATSPTPQSSWSYSTHVDEMTSKPVRLAFIRSDNSMDLAFPYKGPNYGSLTVRRGKKGDEVIFRIDKGQTMCRNYEYACPIDVRFDDAQPVRFLGIGPTDNSSEVAFLNNPAKFIQLASKAKRIRVGMSIYQAGTQVLEFSTPQPLEWGEKPSPASKPAQRP
jgi:hypothetical protein